MYAAAGRRIALCVAVVALVAAIAASVGAGRTSVPNGTAAGASGSITWWVFYRPLLSLDPVKFEDYPENTILGNLCEPLLTVTPTYKIVPNLASKVDGSNPDKWVFTIRSGVRFWDGTKMTVDDVVYSLKRNFVPTNASVFGFTFFRDVKSVAKTGANKVTITLKAPDVTFPIRVVTGATAVISKRHAVKQGDKLGTPGGGIMCTGPYKVARWDGATKLVAKRNAAYWNTQAKPSVDEITFTWPQDPGVVANAFTSGELDGGFNLPPGSAAKLKGSSAGTLRVGTPNQSLMVESLAFINPAGSAAADARVRQALDLAVDRKALVAAAFNGLAIPAYTLTPPGTWGYERKTFSAAYAKAVRPQNLDKAKELVEQAGAVAKKPIVVATPAGQAISINQISIIQQNAKSIGLDLQIKALPPEQYGALFSDPSARAGINALITIGYDHAPDPLAYYDDALGPTGIANFTGYSNPAVTKLLAQAKAERSTAKRAALVVKIQQHYLKDLPAITLLSPLTTVFERKGLTGAPLTYSYQSTAWTTALRAG
jgi:peptide/nickel transport system substrate-binding protein